MSRLFPAKSLVVAAFALGAVGVASAAHAGTDVFLSIGINAPGGYVQPAPVYANPQPVYVQPQPVYVQPQPVYGPPPVVYQGRGRIRERTGPYGDWDRDGIPNRFDRDWRHHEQRVASRRGAWGYADDGGHTYQTPPAPPTVH